MNNWIRVSHYQPCPICKKPDWCVVGEKGVNCMRVESDHPVKNGGWMHFFGGTTPAPTRNHSRPSPKLTKLLEPIVLESILKTWQLKSDEKVSELATKLGVEKLALKELGACYSPEDQAFAFPMRDPGGNIVGVRLRSDTRKWAIKGSKSALFIPFDAARRLSIKTVLICEGPTDTSAALSLGFFAIGRPACLGCEEMVQTLLRDLGTSEAVICYDNDGPGIRGAEKLANTITCPVVRFVPPLKDLRAYVAQGGTREVLLCMINNCVRTRK